ncbi:MAG: hypothetical protein CBC35_01150 [Planctomycetes bacterium TMED75]|nr:bifunctional heptose 7-phosphate kinase/heptose 1-phosphate adenyltransferase [Planctomycetaceae bacterium]OUU96410.1 MAG: hypothetical protein CBC35_01150 [Planctomycetes bacterium TMED75]
MNADPENIFLKLCRAVDEFSSFKVLLVGDFMLDQQIKGTVERLSPEAPVPILRARSHQDVCSTPGGSGNVAACLTALGGEVHCVGVVGNDSEGRLLRAGLEEIGCDVSGLTTDETRPTTVKQSLVGLAQHRHPQKMFRLDFESTAPLSTAMEAALLNGFEAAITGSDVICIEDYGKGVCSEHVCQEVIRLASKHGVPVLVDPAPRTSYELYSGANLITPNRSEAELVLGDSIEQVSSDDGGVARGKRLAAALRSSLGIEQVVVTIDREGAVLAHNAQSSPVHIPTRVRNVYDVTGAGDVVLAVLAASYAHSLDPVDSIHLANVAAGLEVETFGVRPIPLHELRHALLHEVPGGASNHRELGQLVEELDRLRSQGRRIVLTNGCFDVIHAGHVAYLREASLVGDVLVVGLNSDHQVAALKGPDRPIFTQQERLEILGELKCIDYLVVFEEPGAHELIKAVRPDVYVKGGDYAPEEIAEFDLLNELGVEVRVLALRPGLGSSALIERIRSEP